MTASDHADVWVLLGPHKGDNNQVLALAEALGLPFRSIDCRYRWYGHLPAVCRAESLSPLTAECRIEIAAPWPSLVLGIGQRSAPVARYIKRQSGGRTKVVRLGDPMVNPALFDLVITTTQYAVRDAANVIRLPVTITTAGETPPDGVEGRWLEQFARPRRLLIIGGKTSLWSFPPRAISDAAKELNDRARREGGSVIAVTSPRTSPQLLTAARESLGPANVVAGPFPRYGVLLSEADEVHVTGDSVSMLSDAIASGKPVGLVRLQPNLVAGFLHWVGRIRGKRLRIRNLHAFWDDLEARGLAGTISHPRSGSLEVSSLEIAVSAIRKLIDTTIPTDNVIPLILPVRETQAHATGAGA